MIEVETEAGSRGLGAFHARKGPLHKRVRDIIVFLHARGVSTPRLPGRGPLMKHPAGHASVYDLSVLRSGLLGGL